MKKQLRRKGVNRRFDARHRQLMFERCEDRLTLSGSSAVLNDAAVSEGGFISLDAGDFLSPPTNNFLAVDSLAPTFRIDPGIIATTVEIDSAPNVWTLSNSLDLSRVLVYNSTGADSRGLEIGTAIQVAGGEFNAFQIDYHSDLSLISNGIRSAGITGALLIYSPGDETIPPSSDISGEIPSTEVLSNAESQIVEVNTVGDQLRFDPRGTFADQSIPRVDLAKPFAERLDHVFTNVNDQLQPPETSLGATTIKGARDMGLSAHVGTYMVGVDESLPSAEAVKVLEAAKSPRESVEVIDAPGELPQDYAQGISVQSVPLVIGTEGDRVGRLNRNDNEAFSDSAEGGPIEVAQVVLDTQQAYESKVFSAVAVLLDDENTLALPTPPVGQPLSGELARSVAFETVGLPPTDDSAQFDDSHASSAAAATLNEVDTERSRALAFAQWPLVFSATVGAVLLGPRRRSQSNAAQHPPRRNRQATAP